MKHIKLYEEYTDDEIMDLIGGLKKVGHSRVPLDIDFGPFKGMGDKEREMDLVDSWSFPAPEGEIKVKSGSVKFSPKKDLKVVLNMTNGDVIEMEVEHRGGGTSFSVNGDWPTPLQYQDWGSDYPYTMDALTRYDHYLVTKYRYGEKPTFFQRLKKKLGLSESYSDEEIRSLMGDLGKAGHSRVHLDIDYGPFKGMGDKDKKEEIDAADFWSFKTPGGEVKVKSGSIKFAPDKKASLILNLTNGDVIKMNDEEHDETSFYVNGNPIVFPEDAEEFYPYTLAALKRYEKYWEDKSKKTPSMFQNLKRKLGLSESYSDDEIRGLIGDLRTVGHSLTEEEEDMLKFVVQFGGDMDPEDYAETLYDYFTNPEEYEIDKEGDYYDMIWYLYENSVEDHARFNLSGPMRMGGYDRWDTAKIEQEPLYKLYLKMSDYYNQNKK